MAINWIERQGGLPDYIRRVAKHIRESNPSYSQGRAIQAAISQIRKWAATSEDPKVKATAAAALAQWEAMKARERATK